MTITGSLVRRTIALIVGAVLVASLVFYDSGSVHAASPLPAVAPTASPSRAPDAAPAADQPKTAPGTSRSPAPTPKPARKPGSAPAATTSPATSSQYAAELLTDHPLVYYRLDETGGTVAADSSGNGQQGAYTPGVGFGAPGALVNDPNTAVSNPGGGFFGQPMVTQSGANLPGANDARTLELWYRSGNSTGNWLMRYGEYSNRQFGLYADGTLHVYGDSGHRVDVAPTHPLYDGAWHLLDVTYDGGAATVYMDGQAIGSGGLPVSTLVPGNGLGIGAAVSDFDEAAVFPSALTGTQVGAHFQAGRSTESSIAVSSSSNPSNPGQPVTLNARVSGSGSVTPTGLVTLNDGSSSIAAVALNNGQADFSLSSLAAGVHGLTVSYAGDSTFVGSASQPLPQRVGPKAATATSLQSSPNPSTAAQPVTLTASVVANGSTASPSGDIEFTDGAGILGTAPSTMGSGGTATATLTVTRLTSGSHALTATYKGDVNFAGSTSTSVPQTVTGAQSSKTTLISSPNPSGFGQSVTLTAMVAATSGTGTPTGSVTFSEGSAALGVASLNAAGQATFAVSTLTVGTHSLTAVYGGDAVFLSSSSGPLDQVVDQRAGTSTTLTSSLNPSAAGQSVTFTATVTSLVAGVGRPAGSVDFIDGSTSLGVATLSTSGEATLTIATLGVGSHSITAVYGGNANFSNSTSAALIQAVNQPIGTTLTVASSLNPSTFGEQVTLTAILKPASSGIAPPSADVTFRDGSSALGTGRLDGTSRATLTTSSLGAGAHTITAAYAGDANYAAATSAAVTQTVNQARTSTALTADLNPARAGTSITFTATVSTVQPGMGTPTGNVTFNDGPTALGSGALDGSGKAILVTASLGAGDHTITAVYGGDVNFGGSTGPVLKETVTAAIQTTLRLESSSNPAVFGEAVTLTATVGTAQPPSSPPTGQVTFQEGSLTLGSSLLSGAGVATLTVSSLAVGTHSLSAAYVGDLVFGPSTASPLSEVVNQATTTIAVASDMNPSMAGQRVTFTATVSPVAPGAGTAGGSVTFKDGTTTLATTALGTNRSATMTTSSLSLGLHNITAAYGGDANFGASTSSSLIQTVNQATATFTVLTAAPNPSVAGQTVTLTTTVSPAVPGAGTPTGNVSFQDGSTSLGSAALDSAGKATRDVTSLAVGSHQITAAYSGDTAFNGSRSSAVAQEVTATIPTVTAVAADKNPAPFGRPLLLSATVTASPTSLGTPTGSVTFKDGNSSLGTSSLDSSGRAFLTTATLTVGSHSITGSYGGSGRFAPSASGALKELVGAVAMLEFRAPPQKFQAGASSSAMTIQIADAAGHPVSAAPGPVSVSLATDAAFGSFRDLADAKTITTVTIPVGATSASFLYRDSFAGTPTLTASADPSSGLERATQTETVTGAALDHLVLSPPVATAALGSGRSYTAEGFDAFGNDLGDLTPKTTFSIAPDGSCAGSLCTVPSNGAHTVTGASGSARGTATLIGDQAPVPSLKVLNGTGMASHDVGFEVSAAYTGSNKLTFGLDFGDGQSVTGSLPSGPITHTYAGACPGCVAILSVSDGVASPVPNAIGTVDIAPHVQLKAVPGDPQTAVLGSQVHFDGTNSVPAPPGIALYHWDFGDGTAADGAVQNHAYGGTAPKDFTATLTVSGSGDVNTAQVQVHVVPPPSGPGLAVSVQGAGRPLASASVVVEDGKNNVFHGHDLGGGRYHIDALADGQYTVYGYAPGYVPGTASATVKLGTGSTTLSLDAGPVAITELKTQRLTAEQAVAKGIDPTLPGNQNVYQFEVHLAFIPDQPMTLSGIVSGRGIRDAQCVNCGGGGWSPNGSGGGADLGIHVVAQTATVAGQPTIIWMVVPGKAKWLKEFFSVRMLVTNLAPTPFVFQKGTATLNLPAGMSLAELNPGLPPETRSKAIADIPGQTSQGTEWLVRGDAEGFYGLTADYSAVVQPVGAPVKLLAQTDAASQIHVWGGSALRMVVDVDDHAFAAAPYSFPYHARISLTNVADVPVYNPIVELMPLADGDLKRNYLFQPREQYDQGTDKINPGATFTSRDYVLAPNFEGALDLSRSFVVRAGGNAFIPTTVTSHGAPNPFGVPIFAALNQGGQVHLFWEPIKGAISYQVFTTPDFQHSFPSTFLTQVDGTVTDTALPAAPFGELALSTVVLGSDGFQHNVLFHNLTQAQGTALTDPCTAFGWDPYGGTIGNFVYGTTDQRITTAGPHLELTRTYNSLDTRTGAFGTGWRFNYEMSWAADSKRNIAVDYPDGRCELFSKDSNGSFKAPAGYAATLKSDGAGGFVLTQRDRVAYSLGANGRLTSVVDANGRKQLLTYDGANHLAKVQDVASGRALSFTWTGNLIASVATNRVSGQGALTWRYYYTGNALTRACEPRNNAANGMCTAYSYTDGRLAQVTKPLGNVEAAVTYQFDGKMATRTDGTASTTHFEYPMPNVTRTITPLGYASTTTYDGFYRIVEQADPAGNKVSYAYDANGYRSRVVDGNGTVTTMTHDAAGNLTSLTDGEGHTSFYTYDADNQLTVARDGRSASAADNTYATTFVYDTAGDRLSETGPATPDLPSGSKKSWTYTAGSDAAVGGGRMPPGLKLTETDPRGNQTRYVYDSKGDVRSVVDRVGLRTTLTYDEIGRQLSRSVFDAQFPGGVTTTTAYDTAGQVLTITEPSVTNMLTGVPHQRRTASVYDANRNLVQVTVSDVAGGDRPRSTRFRYDGNDRDVAVIDPLGGTITRHYNPDGKVDRVVDQAGRVTTIDFDSRDLPRIVTAKAFVDDPTVPTPPRDVVLSRFEYDAGGRRVADTDALGRVRQSSYDRDDRQTGTTLRGFHEPSGGARDIVLQSTSYDAAGHPTTELSGGNLEKVVNSWDAAGRLTSSSLDPGGLNRTTRYTYDANANVLSRALTDGTRTETTKYTYDQGDRSVSEAVDSGGSQLTKTFAYDQRGNLTATVDPRGNVAGTNQAAFRTDSTYDELNRLASTTDPLVEVQEGTSAPVRLQRTSRTGYDTFGNATQTRDRRNNDTAVTYDALGRRTSVTQPRYVTPDGVTITAVEKYAYDPVGNLLKSTDRRGKSSDYRFDNFDRVVQQLDPQVNGEPARGSTRYAYDDAGNRTGRVDQRGARTEWGYDDLDRMRTQTDVVRQAGAPDQRFTTTYDHDDLGNITLTSDPLGNATGSRYSAASELLQETDALGKVTHYQYDVASRLVRTTDPLGRATGSTYDLAGRRTATTDYDRSGVALATTSFGYDEAGNQTSVTSPLGSKANPTYSNTFTYDAGNRLTQVQQPADRTTKITNRYRYDAEDNLTYFRDGRGQATNSTYTSWNQRQDTIEPATPGQRALADRQFTTIYDAGGLPVTERRPGGVNVSRTFDELGRLRVENASGGGAPAAQRTFGYDLAGLRTSISHPQATIAVVYDDRGLVTSVSGGGGSTTYNYDAAERLVRRADPAGISAFSWTARGELASDTDPLTGVTQNYSWDDASQLTTVTYGPAPAPKRSYQFDDQGRLTSDALVNRAGAPVARYGYGYDADGNVTSQDVVLPGNPQSGTHKYGYDQADRLVSWTDAAGNVTPYAYDDSGNRTQAGSQTFSYDARNRLRTAPDGRYTWTPRGTLASVRKGRTTTNYTFDGLDRLANYNGSVSYSYDGLDRIATRSGTPFIYSGTGPNPVSDGTSVYGRTPAGDLLSVGVGDKSFLSGQDRHGDLSYLFDPTGALVDTRAYDPNGNLATSTGKDSVSAGFQGDFTDPASGKVLMDSRWYAPTTDSFLSRDTVFGQLRTPISLNRYTYAFANPLRYVDPSGHAGIDLSSGDRASQAANRGASSGDAFAKLVGSVLTAAVSVAGTGFRGVSQGGNVAAQMATTADGGIAPRGNAMKQCAGEADCSKTSDQITSINLRSHVCPACGLVINQVIVTGGGGDFFTELGQGILANGLWAARQVAAIVVPFIPVIGQAYMIATAITGHDPILDRDMTTQERMENGAFGLLGVAVLFRGLSVGKSSRLGRTFERTGVRSAEREASQMETKVTQVGISEVEQAAQAVQKVEEAAEKVRMVRQAEDAAAATQQGRHIALGFDLTLDEFAKKLGGSTWKEWAKANPLKWKESFQDLMMNPANRASFDLTGVDVWQGVSRAARGTTYGATDWELLTIRQNPEWWDRITFFRNGEVVPNPFK